MTDPMPFTRGRPHRPAPPPDIIAGSLLRQLTIRVLATHYDRLLASGTPVPAGSLLGLHAQRITSVTEREVVARSLRRSLAEARRPLSMWTARSWVHRVNVVGAEDLIDTITLWLHSPRPVDPRALALLRLLLSDGSGPLYMSGPGDLRARLSAAVAAL